MKMEVEKVIRDGMVAVLYSPGFGAGWSTWQHEEELKAFVMFDRRLVEAAERGASYDEVEEMLEELFGTEFYISTSGWSDIEVAWLPVGTRFEITEYDGAEGIRVFDESEYFVA
jgi:hypothetical protein